MARTRRLGIALGVVLLTGVVTVSVLALITATYVDDPAVFELDGNVRNDTASDGDDWSNAAGTGSGLTSAFRTTGPTSVTGFPFVVPDPTGTSHFHTGGSKDYNDINQWRHTAMTAPDKDEITNAFAAAYRVHDTVDDRDELWIYFGADRFANNGTADIGFWFFQDQVAADGPNGTFTGRHRVGDLLVVVEFTGSATATNPGGVVSDVKVFKWVGSGGDQHQGTTNLIASQVGSANAECNPGSPGKHVCAISNRQEVPTAWPYTPKFAPTTAGNYPVGSLISGGINITQLLGGDVCFSSFMAETRSSTSIPSILKDFVLGNFDVCGVEITKDCDGGTLNAAGDKFVYNVSGTVTNAGFGTLYDVEITDTLPSNATSIEIDADGFDSCVGTVCKVTLDTLGAGECKRWPGGEACTATTYETATFESATNGPSNSASVAAATTDGGTKTVTAGPATDTCPVNTDQPALSVTKQCTTSVSTALAVTVNFTGGVCNQSRFAITGVTGSDIQYNGGSDIGSAHGVTFAGSSPVNLAPCSTPGSCTLSLNPTSCRTFSGSYTPSQVSAGTGACSYVFRDRVTITGNVPLLGTTVSNSNTAECPLCPCP